MRSLLALTISLALIPAGFAERIPPGLELLSRSMPGKLEGLAYFRTDRELMNSFFELLPFGDAYRQVMDERAELFEKRSGVHPFRDVRGVAVAISSDERTGKKGLPVFFLDLTKDARAFAEVLRKDSGVRKFLRFDGPDRGTLGRQSFRVVRGGFFIGPPETLDRLRGETNPGKIGLAKHAAATVPAPARFMIAARLPTAEAREGTDLKAHLSHLRGFTLALGGDVLGTHLYCASEGAAEAMLRYLEDSKAKAEADIQKAVAKKSKVGDSLVDLFDPQSVSARTTEIWTRKLLDGLSFSRKGKQILVEIRGALPKSPFGMFSVPMIGVLAAIAVPNFRAARERANLRACYANQKVLAGATEMYNLDNNTDVKAYDQQFADQLVQQGYLSTIPTDPGQGKDSQGNYYIDTASGNGFACRVHGSVDGAVRGSSSGGASSPLPPAAMGAAPLVKSLLQSFLGRSGGPGRGSISAFAEARDRANERSCFANQKTLMGATEMYQLDHNTQVKQLDPGFLQTLKGEGYLQSVPDDPGSGKGSSTNYYLTEETGAGIACKVHGSIDGAVPPAR